MESLDDHIHFQLIGDNKKQLLDDLSECHYDLEPGLHFSDMDNKQLNHDNELMSVIELKAIEILDKNKVIDDITEYDMNTNMNTVNDNIKEIDINCIIVDLNKECDDSNKKTYRCQICFERSLPYCCDSYTLFCRHTYCKECLVSYIMSKINDGKIDIKCFYIPPDGEVMNNEEIIACDSKITSSVIEDLLAINHKKTFEKYERFVYAKANINARECPYCNTWQLGVPDVTARIICTQCDGTFCYYHSNAHDFEKYPTCEDYEKEIAPLLQESVDLIDKTTKTCPSCQMKVTKSGGCNHMKCQCGTAFCWLCGKQVDDTVFPAHFQWWNPSGCSNLQMNEAVEPSRCARIFARVLGIVQIIVLGPLTLASTLASSVLCCSCLMMKLQLETTTIDTYRAWFSNCMSSWGLFWMIILFMVPLGAIMLGVGLSFFLVSACLLYPMYALSRLLGHNYPWPDRLTDLCYQVLLLNREQRQYHQQTTQDNYTTTNSDNINNDTLSNSGNINNDTLTNNDNINNDTLNNSDHINNDPSTNIKNVNNDLPSNDKINDNELTSCDIKNNNILKNNDTLTNINNMNIVDISTNSDNTNNDTLTNIHQINDNISPDFDIPTTSDNINLDLKASIAITITPTITQSTHTESYIYSINNINADIETGILLL